MAQPFDPPSPDPSRAVVISRWHWRDWLWLALTLAGLAVIYAPGLGNLPVFDDALFTDGTIAERYATLQASPRMLSYGSFVWLEAVVGAGLWKQRLFNMALHIGVVIALWGLYREILRAVVAPEPDPGDPRVAYRESPALGFAIGFFALNPVAVYAVAYLIQRSIVMATLFVVCGLLLFARGLRLRRPWLYAAAIACYLGAVFSKENAIFAPLTALPVYILVARPSPRRVAALVVIVAAVTAIGAAVLWKPLSQILGAPFDEFSRVYLRQLAALNPDAPRHALALSIINEAWLFFEYGVRWFLPFGEWMSISMRPPFPVKWLTFPQILGVPAYVALLVGGFWLLARHRDWRALVGFCITVPALLFGTEFLTVWVQDPIVMYRSYLWAIGIPGLVLLAVHGTPARALLVVAAITGLLLAWQSTERVLSLATPETAWGDAIGKLPKDPRAVGRWFPYLNRGGYYADRDQFELAIRDYEQSAALGDMGIGAYNIGGLLVATGKPRQGLAMLDAAEKQGYNLFNLPVQRGLAYVALDNPAEAFRHFDIARGMQPPSPTREVVLMNLARTALRIGNAQEAELATSQLLATDPRNGEARYLLAMAQVVQGRHEKALATLADAADTTAVHYARALAYHGLGRKAEALREIETAIRVGPVNPALTQWRAKIEAMR